MMDLARVAQLVNELDSVNGLIQHGKATGQDRGEWMENLEADRDQLEEQLRNETTNEKEYS